LPDAANLVGRGVLGCARINQIVSAIYKLNGKSGAGAPKRLLMPYGCDDCMRFFQNLGSGLIPE